MTVTQQPAAETALDYDVLIVGAGFAGLYMLYRARELGLRVRVIDSAGGVGGTWYHNRYPGARCDVESVDYAYSFSPELDAEWDWPERYAAQPDILRYLQYVAERFDLLRDIQLNTRVESAHYDETSRTWLVSTDAGQHLRARFCVMATGCLSAPRVPDFEGMDDFGGTMLHTADWPRDGVDFTGKRVVVIGTGSSGVQCVPEIAEQAAEVVVLQRTPTFVMPTWNRATTPDEMELLRKKLPGRRALAKMMTMGIAFPMRPVNKKSALEVSDEQRLAEYEARWAHGGFGFLASFNDLLTDEAANDTAVEFFHGKIREQVGDPQLAEKLSPTTFPLGAKRLCVAAGYYEALSRDNVRLVDLTVQPIVRLEEHGVRVGDELVECDVIVFATGFDAFTGALSAMDIRGRDGLALQEKWSTGARAYLGLAVAGFPNMFIVTGPGSPSVMSNMVVSIEAHIDFIVGALHELAARGASVIEADVDAESSWVQHVNDIVEPTLYMKAASWYMGANVEGKPRTFLPYIGGVPAYNAKCAQVVRDDYEGFVLTK